MKYLIGVDAGTTSFKAVLCSSDGDEIAVTRREYSLITNADKVEFYPEEYFGEPIRVTDVLDLHGFFPEQVAEIVTEFLQQAIEFGYDDFEHLEEDEDNRRACSLYLSLMDRMGVSLPRFGDTDRRLTDL